MGDAWRRLLVWLRLRRPPRVHDATLEQHDRLAEAIQQDQAELHARLRVLEIQSDIRTERHHGQR
jgi:hypothetical protein